MIKLLISFLFAQLYIANAFTSKDQTNFFKGLLNLTNLPFYTETGYIGVEGKSGTNNQYFYHLFLKDGVTKLSDVKDDDTFAIWLNGGPGCTSQFGSYVELGPIKITTDPKDSSKYVISLREYRWNKITHLLFVDQPFNVGLSYSNATELVNNTDTAAEYFVKFIQEFFTVKKEFAKNKFYIFGESYAGHYIPVITAAFIKSDALKLTNFVGVAIGDGWTSPFYQIGNFGSYLYSIGVIDDNGKSLYNTQLSKTQAALLANDLAATYESYYALDVNKITGGMSSNNFQQYGPDDFAYVKFINDHLSQFDAPQKLKFIHKNFDITNAFSVDILSDRVNEVTEILAAGYKVLIYNGQLDYGINTPGVLSWINNMKWTGIDQWKQQPKNIFTALNPATGQVETQGTYKFYANFYYATVYRAGHLLPRDNPSAAFAMIDSLVNDKWVPKNEKEL